MIIDSPPYRDIPKPVTAPTLVKGQAFSVPEFEGTIIIRATDETDGTFNAISYGIWSAFSCDYTKILVTCDGRFKIITFDPVAGKVLGSIALPASFQGVDAIWSHTSPNLIHHRDGGSRLMELNVDNFVDTELHDFAKDFPDSPNITRMSGDVTDNIFCFARQTPDYSKFSGFCAWNRNSDSITFREPPSRSISYPAPAYSAGTDYPVDQVVSYLGNNYICNSPNGPSSLAAIPDVSPKAWSSACYFKVQTEKTGTKVWNVSRDPFSEWWDLSLPNTQQTLLTPGTGHSAVLTDKIAQYNNDTNCDELKPFGAVSGLVTMRWPDWAIATEYSGTDADEGWYTVTAAFNPEIAAKLDPPVAAQGPLHDELIQVATDGSGRVRRLCHMHAALAAGDYDTIPKPATGYGAFQWIAFFSPMGQAGRRDVFLAKVDTEIPIVKPIIKAAVVVVVSADIVLYGSFAGKSVTATVGGLPARLDYSGAPQVNIGVPQPLIGKGTAEVVVTVDGKDSEPFPVVV
jgi:hypothetical protein